MRLTEGSIGRPGTRFAAEKRQVASIRRPSTCCRGWRKSDTCRPVGNASPHPDPPPEGEGNSNLQERREVSPSCPFCRSTDTEIISLFGSQVMTMQCKCRACGSFYEAIKY